MGGYGIGFRFEQQRIFKGAETLETIEITTELSTTTSCIYQEPIKSLFGKRGVIMFKCALPDQNPVYNHIINANYISSKNMVPVYPTPLKNLNLSASSPSEDITNMLCLKCKQVNLPPTPKELFSIIAKGDQITNYARDIDIHNIANSNYYNNKKKNNSDSDSEEEKSVSDVLYNKEDEELFQYCQPYLLDYMNEFDEGIEETESGNFRNNLMKLAKVDKDYVKVHGFSDCYGYYRKGLDSFAIHTEQIAAPFIHHQLFGHAIWYFISSKQRKEFMIWLRKYIVYKTVAKPHTNNTLKQWIEPGAYNKLNINNEIESLIDLIIIAKRIIPDPLEIQENGFNILEVHVTEDTYIMGNGDWFHYGINTCPISVGFAINILPVNWITYGIDYIYEILNSFILADIFIKKVKKNPMEVLHDTTTVPAFSVCLQENNDVVHNALNNIPHQFTCALLHGLKTEIEEKIKNPESKNLTVDLPQLETKEYQRLNQLIIKNIQMLHQLKLFFKSCKQNPTCNCSSGK